jgi:hypothetical protein
LSFSGDESPSPVVTPQPTEESDQSEAANLDASELPLSRSWTWYYLNNQSKNWDERINKIAEVKTVEDFWKTYGRIKLPTHISVGCDLMFFQRYVFNFLPQIFSDKNTSVVTVTGNRVRGYLYSYKAQQRWYEIWPETDLVRVWS